MEQSEEKNNIPKDTNNKSSLFGKSEEKIDRYIVGTRVFLRCLCFLAAIFLADLLFAIFRGNDPQLIREVLEIVKTLLFTICGYLFGRSEFNSRKENKRDKNS